MVARVDLPLSRARRHGISEEGRLAIVGQVAILGRENGGSDAGPAGKLAIRNATLALATTQSEPVAAVSGRESRAGAGRVPSTGADDTTVLGAIDVYNKVALAGKGAGAGGSGGGSGLCSSTGGGSRRASARALREILDSRAWAGGLRSIRLGGDEFASLDGTADTVVVPYLVQGTTTASEGNLLAMLRLKCSLDLGRSIRLRSGGGDAGRRQPLNRVLISSWIYFLFIKDLPRMTATS